MQVAGQVGIERGRVLRKAQEVINGERQDMYGNAEDSFRDIGALWSWYLGMEVKARDVAMMMVLFKLAREKHQWKRDNVVDACGYLGLYEDIMESGKSGAIERMKAVVKGVSEA